MEAGRARQPTASNSQETLSLSHRHKHKHKCEANATNKHRGGMDPDSRHLGIYLFLPLKSLPLTSLWSKSLRDVDLQLSATYLTKTLRPQPAQTEPGHTSYNPMWRALLASTIQIPRRQFR